MNSKGDPNYNIVILGVWTINIKDRLKYLTDDPNDSLAHYLVLRGITHLRPRPENSRFVQGSIQESLLKRKITDPFEWNWIGETWRKQHNNGKMSSLNQISAGLKEEAMVQLELAMGKVKDQKAVVEAKINIKQTWQNLISEAQVPDLDKSLLLLRG